MKAHNGIEINETELRSRNAWNYEKILTFKLHLRNLAAFHFFNFYHQVSKLSTFYSINNSFNCYPTRSVGGAHDFVYYFIYPIVNKKNIINV